MLRREGFAEKEGFKSGMKERVGDRELIIISVTVSGINKILQLNASHNCHQHHQHDTNIYFTLLLPRCFSSTITTITSIAMTMPRTTEIPVSAVIAARSTSCLRLISSSLLSAVPVAIRYDTRCYFNVRSKANMSQLNLPHGNNN